MSFIHDFIMESNQLEDMILYEQKKKVDKKKPPKKEMKAQEPIEEGCNKKEPKKTKSVNEAEIKKEEIKEEEVNEELTEEYVDIEDYLPPEAYVTSFKESLEEQPKVPTKAEQMMEEKRKRREQSYRELARIDEDFEIKEDNIDDWALKWASMWGGTDPEKLKAELLHRPYEMPKDDSEDK